MNFKKIGLVALTSATLVAPCTTSIFAEDSKGANLTYGVTQGYTWTIHSNIDFGQNEGAGKTIEKTGNKINVTSNVLEAGKSLKITVKGSGSGDAFTLTNGGTETLTYHVLDKESELQTGDTVLTVASGTNEAEKDLTFKLNTTDKTSEVAGNYTGTVTYTASVVAD